MTEIIHASTDEHIKQAKQLFIEYASSLDFDLCFQNFDKEIDEMPGKYSPPYGRLLLAKSDGEYAGCIALRKIEESICEMKRLFVRPEFRGRQIGKLLTDKLLEEARKTGYKKMRLDTIENKMPDAVRLYKTYGFYEIDAYYDNPEPGVLYMELIL